MKKKVIILSCLIISFVILISLTVFDAYKFFKLETFPKERIQNVCITMSEAEEGRFEEIPFKNENGYVFYLLNNDENKNALFVLQKMYYHNIKQTERYKVKFENTDTENTVSSLSFKLNDNDNLLIYHWNNHSNISKIRYELLDKNGKTTEKEAECENNIIFIPYNPEENRVSKIDFLDKNNTVLYGEQREEGSIVSSENLK